MSQETATVLKESSRSGESYDAMLSEMDERFASLGNVPLFTTDVDGQALWDAYLSAFPENERQLHNCSACRHFIRRFGGLVTLDEQGKTTPAIWHGDLAATGLEASIATMRGMVAKAKVNGVFLSSEPVFGQPVTGEWTHFHVYPHRDMVHKSKVLTAFQAMAEKREDHTNVMRALQEFPPPLVEQALAVLKSEALYRSEKVMGPAQWLADLHTACAKANRSNVVWRAVATAPDGFCHPRSSMIGTLLEDLQSGMAFEVVARRFKDKMRPDLYQRPQAAPSLGTIQQAEKLVEQLGLAPSLERRFARLDEIETVWRPEPEAPKPGGVFGHLKAKDAPESKQVNLPVQSITWVKFARDVLPTAKSIDVLAPHHGGYMALVTATNPDAPPLLQWDRDEQRNPFSHYMWVNGSSAEQWGLRGGSWVKVTAITHHPSTWYGGKLLNNANYSMFILDGCRDSRDGGLALFPETLKSELHSVRSVIEAHSRSGKLTGREEALACGLAHDIRCRVTSANGIVGNYRLDRWE